MNKDRGPSPQQRDRVRLENGKKIIRLRLYKTTHYYK